MKDWEDWTRVSLKYFSFAQRIYLAPSTISRGGSGEVTPSKPLWKTTEQVTDVATARRDLVG